MVDRERPPIAVLITVFIVELLVLFVGLIVFYGATQSPSFERYRTLDIIRFLGCGGCWGAALAGIGAMVGWMRHGRSNSNLRGTINSEINAGGPKDGER